jgi:hypothetical protein
VSTLLQSHNTTLLVVYLTSRVCKMVMQSSKGCNQEPPQGSLTCLLRICMVYTQSIPSHTCFSLHASISFHMCYGDMPWHQYMYERPDLKGIQSNR